MQLDELKIDDLKVGDIILFSALEDDPLSQMIAKLTDTNISHSALCYDNENLVEEIDEGTQKKPFVERFSDRTIYIQRLKTDKELSFKPVLDKADYFLEQNEPYNFADLYLGGILLLGKKSLPKLIDNKHTLAILKFLTYSLVSFYNNRKYPNKAPMVCSQFVVECYKAGGEDYKLDFKDTYLESSPTSDILDESQDNIAIKKSTNKQDSTLSLVEKALISVEQGSVDVSKRHLENTQSNHTAEDIKEHVSNLLEIFDDSDLGVDAQLEKTGTDNNVSSQLTQTLSDELHHAIIDFAHAHQRLHDTQISTSEEKTKESSLLALGSVMDYHSSFITPADLYKHTTNLETVGKVERKE